MQKSKKNNFVGRNKNEVYQLTLIRFCKSTLARCGRQLVARPPLTVVRNLFAPRTMKVIFNATHLHANAQL